MNERTPEYGARAVLCAHDVRTAQRGSEGGYMRTGGRVGVLLVNTGSPSAPEAEAVKAYLAEFLMDPCVRPCPAPIWWPILHLCILPTRKRRSAAKYRLIWREEGAPLIVGARNLAARAEETLVSVDLAPQDAAPLVRAAMSYGEPSIADALVELRAAGCTRLVVIPLYPQSATSTTGAVLRRVRSALEAIAWKPSVHEVSSYGDNPIYLDALAARIEEVGFDPARDRLMFSFHAVPQPDIKAGDTYPDQVRETCRAVAARLGIDTGRWTLSFQSPFADGRLWHGPFTTEILEDVAARCEGRLFFICPGFSIDCLETLYDVEHVFSERARAAFPKDGGGHGFVYVPCLNDSDAAARLMADLAARAAGLR